MDLDHGLAAILEQIAWLLTLLFELSIVAVLWRRRSLRRFTWFALYLCADSIRSTALWILARSTFTETYTKLWVFSEPVMLAIHFALVWEVILLLYKVYPGIHSFARIAIVIAISVAVFLTIFTEPFEVRRATRDPLDTLLVHFFQIERVYDLVLGLFTLVMVRLFPPQHYAVAVRQHGFLLSALFCTASAGFYAINYGFNVEITGLATLLIQLALYAVWIKVFMAPDPEPLPAPSPEEFARIEQLNDDLLFMAQWLTRKKG